jgi:hypothetical protein
MILLSDGLQSTSGPVRELKWSPDGNWMISGHYSGRLGYYQSSMNCVQDFEGHKETITKVSFAPTCAKFASASYDRTVRIWDFESCKTDVILEGHLDQVKGCSWHPTKGLVATGCKDRSIKLWDPRTGSKSVTTFTDFHKHIVQSVEWNKNGNWLLTASCDKTIKMLDVRTMQAVETYRGQDKEHCEVNLVSWHPVHENIFASANMDGTINFWDTALDTPINSIYGAHSAAVWSLSWHPVGHMIISGGNDCCIKFWCRNRPGDSSENRFVNIYSTAQYPEYVTTSSAVPTTAIIPGLGTSAAGLMAMPVTSQVRVGRQVPDGYVCNRCGESTHFINDCPIPAGPRVPPENYVCNICNQKGHFITECPQKAPPPEGYTCHLCGSSAHYKNDCPKNFMPGGPGRGGFNQRGGFGFNQRGGFQRGGFANRGGSSRGNRFQDGI